MTKYGVGAIVAVGLALVANDLSAALGLNLREFGEQMAPSTAEPLPRAWDLARTLITFVAVVLLALVTLRSRTANVLREELNAVRDRANRLHNDLDEALKQLRVKDAEITTLRGRTDLSEVLNALKTITEASAEHDRGVMLALTDFVKASEARYAEASQILNKLLATLAEGTQGSLRQAQDNHAVIVKLMAMVEQLSKRVTVVQRDMKDVKAATAGDGGDEGGNEAA